MIGLVGDSLGRISMEPTEEESGEAGEQHPSLPPNYVSLAQLQERWLQRQKQKQEIEEQKEKREPILLIGESRSQQEKGKKKFWGKKQGRERNGRRREEGGAKVCMPDGVLEGNSPEIGAAERELKHEEFKVGALAHRGVDGAGGMEENNVSWKKNKNNWKKRVSRVKGSLTGELENRGNLGDFSRKNGGEEACREEFGRSNRDREVDGKVSVCVVSVVPGNKGKEVTLGGVGGGGDKGFGEEDSRTSNDWTVGESSTMGLKKVLPEIGSAKEGSAAVYEEYQGMLETGSVSVVEVSLENKVEKYCSVNVGRKRGERRFRIRYKRNVDNSRRWGGSTDSKVELGCKENAVEKGVLNKEECRNHKGTITRGIEAYGDTEMVSGNHLPKLRRDLRFLSLDESRVGNAALRRGRHHGWQQRRNEKSRDVNNLVWMKKGEILNTNVPEI